MKDIQHALRGACRKVLDDTSGPDIFGRFSRRRKLSRLFSIWGSELLLVARKQHRDESSTGEGHCRAGPDSMTEDDESEGSCTDPDNVHSEESIRDRFEVAMFMASVENSMGKGKEDLVKKSQEHLQQRKRTAAT